MPDKTLRNDKNSESINLLSNSKKEDIVIETRYNTSENITPDPLVLGSEATSSRVDKTYNNEGEADYDRHEGYWLTKIKKALFFLGTGPFLSLKSLISGVISGNHAETIRSGIEGSALVIETIGFGGFIKRIRDSKFFQTISNGIEYFFPKPVRSLVAIGCAIAAILTTGGWMAIAGLAISLAAKAYSIYSDIKTYKKTESKIEELSLAKKTLIGIAAKNQAIELLKDHTSNINLKELVYDFEKSISSNITRSEPEKDLKTPNFLLAISENAGAFSTSIAGGLAMTAIRTVGATAYADMKLLKIYNGLKAQISEIKGKIPPYDNKIDLINQLNNQNYLVQTLTDLGTDQQFLSCTDKEQAMEILKDKFNELKYNSTNAANLKEEPSNWKAFLDTENRSSNYGNITHDDYIKSEDKSVLDFENTMKTRLRKVKDELLKEQDIKKNIETISIDLQGMYEESITQPVKNLSKIKKEKIVPIKQS